MISDLDLAQACAAIYVSPASIPVPASGVYVRVTEATDGLIVAFRGSVTPQDWWRDFNTIAVMPRLHPQLGLCHAGFIDAAESIVGAVRTAIANRPFCLTGHSLGGAEAVAIGGLLVCMGVIPVMIATFGAPRVGMRKFVGVLSAVKSLRQYRRGNDPVPDVPFFLPLIYRYRITREPLIQVGQEQADPFACHAIAGYVADVGSATP